MGTSQQHVETATLSDESAKFNGVRKSSSEDGATATAVDLLPKVCSTPVFRHDVDSDSRSVIMESARTIGDCTDNAEFTKIVPSYDSDGTVDFGNIRQSSSNRSKSISGGGAGNAQSAS